MNEIEKTLTYTVPEVAKLLKISLSKAYLLTKTEDFPSIKIGRRILIPREEFMEWMKSQVVQKASI